jgi:ATP-dependent RNA helicase DDX23/PRP28
LESFRSGKAEVLVATDLAGRGLDVLGVTAVINYDAPKNINEFIHRAGRTGRAGMKGKAFTLLTGADEAIFYDVKEFL